MIRAATEADLPAILAITNDAIRNTTAMWTTTQETLEARTEWWRDRTQAGFPVLVAGREGDVLGFASYGPFRAWEGYVHTVEHSVYVDSGARGRGVGRALVLELVDRAMRQRKHVMVAGIEGENTASLRMHAGLGFVETGRLAQVGRKFDRWLDLVLMQRQLT
jgi:phosphinothricin acetyltransferase